MKPLKIIYYVSLGIIALLALLLIFSTFPIPGNYKLLVVQSGSMAPAIKLGNVVVVKPAQDYQKGDIITFGDTKNPKNMITHRIFEVKKNKGETSYITKGDANNAPDTGEITQGEVIGKVLFSLPLIGYGVAAARQPIGFMLLIILPATLIIYDEIRKIKDEVVKMHSKKALFFLLAFSVSLMTFNFTKAFLADTETSTGNTFQVTTWGVWKQTSKGDFEKGILSNVDTTTSPGDVMLTGAYPVEGDTRALWHLNEGSGTTTDDSSSNNNDGTLGDGTCSSGSGTCPSWTSGKYGNALDFDGADDYFKVPDSDSLDITTKVTYEAWIKLDSTPSTGKWYNILEKSPGISFAIYGSSDGKKVLQAWIKIGGTWKWVDCTTDLATKIGNWTHVAGSYNGNQIKCFVNGIEEASKLQTGNLDTGTGHLIIGSSSTLISNFDGVIDEVSISNTAKTSFPIDYFSPGTLESQVFNGGEDRDWDLLKWDKDLPAGTNITFRVATSNGEPDWIWTWQPTLGDLTGLPDSRYLKWEATLTRTDSDTPKLEEVRVRHYSP